MARGCLTDMQESYNLPDAGNTPFWNATVLLAVTPHANSPRFEDEDGDGVDGLVQAYLEPLLAEQNLPLNRALCQVIPFGHAGTAVALRAALDLLADGSCERVIVLGVDSYLDPITLDWLAGDDRLKHDDNPVGLMPGECGACFMVETERSAQARKAPVRARAVAVVTDKERNHLFSGQPNDGSALAACVRGALAAGPSPFSGDIVMDLNGEPWRAHEWGMAIALLGGALGAVRLQVPAMSVGETGAASGVLGVCVAAHSFWRGASHCDQALVISSSEWGDIGAIALGAPPTIGAIP